MLTNDIGNGWSQWRRSVCYTAVSLGSACRVAYTFGKKYNKKKAHGAWLALHKARLTFTIPLLSLQSVADKERNGVPISYLKGLSEIPPTYEKGYLERKMDVTKCYNKLTR